MIRNTLNNIEINEAFLFAYFFLLFFCGKDTKGKSQFVLEKHTLWTYLLLKLPAD